jgi:hypothetical protein
LAERLAQRGFAKQGEEAWLVLEHLLEFDPLPLHSSVLIKRVTRADLTSFVQMFVSAFDMPADFAPFMVQLTEPSLDLPGVYHFLAFMQSEPVGTCSVICYQGVGILGSVGVAPTHRGSKAGANLVYTAISQAQQQAVDTLLVQTAAGAPLERLLRIQGFKKIFTRTAYTLNSDAG